MNVRTIRAAIGTRLETVFSRVSTQNDDQINPPCAVMSGPDPIQYAETFDAGHRLTFTIRAVVQRNVPRSSQATLDDYLGDEEGSIYAAFEADKTLGGVVASAQITTAQNIGNIQDGEVIYAVVDLTLDVMT